MSGGSLDYAYDKVESAASEIRARAENPLQAAFAEHLFRVGMALKDLEWHYSCDIHNPEPQSVRGVVSAQDVLEAATVRANVALHNLNTALEGVKDYDRK